MLTFLHKFVTLLTPKYQYNSGTSLLECRWVTGRMWLPAWRDWLSVHCPFLSPLVLDLLHRVLIYNGVIGGRIRTAPCPGSSLVASGLDYTPAILVCTATRCLWLIPHPVR